MLEILCGGSKLLKKFGKEMIYSLVKKFLKRATLTILRLLYNLLIQWLKNPDPQYIAPGLRELNIDVLKRYIYCLQNQKHFK